MSWETAWLQQSSPARKVCSRLQTRKLDDQLLVVPGRQSKAFPPWCKIEETHPGAEQTGTELKSLSHNFCRGAGSHFSAARLARPSYPPILSCERLSAAVGGAQVPSLCLSPPSADRHNPPPDSLEFLPNGAWRPPFAFRP